MMKILACAFLALASVASAASNPFIDERETSFNDEETYYGITADHLTCAIAMLSVDQRIDALIFGKWSENKMQTAIDKANMFRETGFFGFTEYVRALTRENAQFIIRSTGVTDLTLIMDYVASCKTMQRS